MQSLLTVTSLDFSAVVGHHAMPAGLLLCDEQGAILYEDRSCLKQLHDSYSCGCLIQNLLKLAKIG